MIIFYYLGQVYPPLNKTEIVVLSGVNATLNWTFVGDPLLATRTWYFTRRSPGSKEEEIAYKRRTDNADILSSSLPRIEMEDPATLVLRNVDKRYNGKYRLLVAVSEGGGQSSVEFFIAGKFLIKHEFNI